MSNEIDYIASELQKAEEHIKDIEQKLARQSEISIKAIDILEYITTRSLIKVWTCDGGAIQELKAKINELNRLTGNEI